jgi:hypothetical protein
MTSNFFLGLAVLGTFRSVTKDVNPSRPARKDAIENSAEFTPTIVGKNKNGNSLVRMHLPILIAWLAGRFDTIVRSVCCAGGHSSHRGRLGFSP